MPETTSRNSKTEVPPNLSVICYGYRASEVKDWIARNSDVVNGVVKVFGLYHLEDVTGRQIQECDSVTLKLGHACPLERIKAIEALILTDYVLLCAADDTISALPPVLNDFDVGVGIYYFQSEQEFHPSISNILDFSRNNLDNFNKYWTFPGPGDNSVFYSIYKKGIFFETLGVLGYFEAWDWVFVSKVILKAEKVVRLANFKIMRSVTPTLNYTRRVLDEYKTAGLDPNDWRMQNPILFALKLVSESICSPLTEHVLECWSKYLEIKFHEMIEVSTEYAEVIDEDDINRLAHFLARELTALKQSDIITPKVRLL
jgi:hypothetical protein